LSFGFSSSARTLSFRCASFAFAFSTFAFLYSSCRFILLRILDTLSTPIASEQRRPATGWAKKKKWLKFENSERKGRPRDSPTLSKVQSISGASELNGKAHKTPSVSASSSSRNIYHHRPPTFRDRILPTNKRRETTGSA
jgi:hypothetical protein